MSKIIINNITFYYTSPYKLIFENLNMNIDSNWKTGIVGRNGRGKTTLLKLIQNILLPQKGDIKNPFNTFIFPFETDYNNKTVFDFIKNNVAPFDKWEKQMLTYTNNPNKENLTKFSEIQEKFIQNGGYEIESMIFKEINEMSFPQEILTREINTLSAGELTRIMIIILFLKNNNFPLIDEPTNHLDIIGRETLANYLKQKKGYILVSHDRYFLDLCIDHIISINKSDVRINKCNYSEWEYNMKLELETEKKKKAKILSEIKSLKKAAQNSRKWSNKKESEKAPHSDKGAIGAQAAKLMKSAINFEKRIEKNISSKENLMKNEEKNYDIKILNDSKIPSNILEIIDLKIKYDNNTILENFNMHLSKGDRIALLGKNGSGKTSIIKAILNEIDYFGEIILPEFIKISISRQIPFWNKGLLKNHITKTNINELKFREVLGNFNVRGDIWNKPLENFSEGERKKIELCRSILEPVMLLIWDEPMNYIDIPTREKIEQSIIKHEPTILFIEHDKYFIENIATKVIEL